MAVVGWSFERMIVSVPVGVEWAGWQSNTSRLQLCGWRLAVEHDYERRKYRLLMRHESLDLMAISDQLILHEYFGRYRRQSQDDGCIPPIFRVAHVARTLQAIRGVEAMRPEAAGFHEIDARPQAFAFQEISPTGIFPPMARKAEQVLIDRADMTVIEHLEAIKNLQSAKQRELREKAAREDAARPERSTPRLHVVAQLINYEDVAA